MNSHQLKMEIAKRLLAKYQSDVTFDDLIARMQALSPEEKAAFVNSYLYYGNALNDIYLRHMEEMQAKAEAQAEVMVADDTVTMGQFKTMLGVQE